MDPWVGQNIYDDVNLDEFIINQGRGGLGH